MTPRWAKASLVALGYLSFTLLVCTQATFPRLSMATVLTTKDAVEEDLQQALVLLREGTPLERVNAAELLGRHSTLIPSAVPALARAVVDDPSADVREQAAHSLEQFGPKAHPVASCLVDALSDPSQPVRLEAAFALASIATRDQVSTNVLLSKFETSSGRLQVAVGYALKSLDPALADSELDLQKLGDRAESYLVEALGRTTGRDVKHWAAALCALAHTTAAQLVPRLIEDAGPRADTTSANARYALEVIGKHHPTLVEDLQNTADSGSTEQKVRAIEALGFLGQAASGAVATLVDELEQSEDKGVQLAVAKSLQRLGPHARSAADELADIARESDGATLRAVVLALAHVDANTAEALLPWLEEAHLDIALEVRRELLRSTL